MIGKFIIFGDSYSTHREFIPKEFYSFYHTGGRTPEEPWTDMRPEETWWGRLISDTDATLVHNNSWSGSTIGYTGYSGDCSHTNSFIYRYRQLRESGFFEKNEIDTIFVFGGTNDSWCEAPLGEIKHSDFKETDLFSVLPAICYFMIKLKEDFPDKRLVFISNCDIKPEIRDCMVKTAELIGATVVELRDIEKVQRHPNVNGMRAIADQVIETLSKNG